jgi:thymidylate synthase
MQSYHDLLRFVVNHGTPSETRAILRSTGTKVSAYEVKLATWRHDLGSGFPLVTTKFVSFKTIVHELIWFLRGDQDIGYLKDNGVTIWNEWARPSGFVGPIYGKQWREWGAHGEDGSYRMIDQIAQLVVDIKAVRDDPTHPARRRLKVSAWNVGELDSMVLPPCHTGFVMDVTNGKLSCYVEMRSCDIFLGMPYNIASYSALTHLIANICGLNVGEIGFSVVNLHLYSNHREAVVEQLLRTPYALPSLEVKASDVDSATIEDFVLSGYRHHPTLKGEVAV